MFSKMLINSELLFLKDLGLVLKINFHSFCVRCSDIFEIIFLACAIGSNLYGKSRKFSNEDYAPYVDKKK